MTEALNKLVARIPGWAWLAVGGLLVGAFWWQQHDARIRQQARLQQVRQQTSAEVAALRKQAAQDVKQANVENAKAIAKLEQRRQQVEQQNRQLAAQLGRLRKQAQIQAGEVATLPISKIVTRVAAQLGLKAQDVAGKEKASSRKGVKAQRKLQVTNYELQDPAVTAGSHTSQEPRRMRHPERAGMAKNAISAPPEGETTPHPAAGASTLSPRRGLGETSFADMAEDATSASAEAKKGQTADIAKNATSAPPDGDAALALTDSGARKVETALVELKACRAESDIQGRQVSNCQVRAEADEAEVKRLKSSVASLNRALDAKDKILTQQASECKAELRAARGTFWGRLVHAAEHVAVGLAMGVAIGVAAK